VAPGHLFLFGNEKPPERSEGFSQAADDNTDLSNLLFYRNDLIYFTTVAGRSNGC
jgi:hypothetical protein